MVWLSVGPYNNGIIMLCARGRVLDETRSGERSGTKNGIICILLLDFSDWSARNSHPRTPPNHDNYQKIFLALYDINHDDNCRLLMVHFIVIDVLRGMGIHFNNST